MASASQKQFYVNKMFLKDEQWLIYAEQKSGDDVELKEGSSFGGKPVKATPEAHVLLVESNSPRERIFILENPRDATAIKEGAFYDFT